MDFTRDSEHIQKGLFIIRFGVSLYFLGQGILFVIHPQLLLSSFEKFNIVLPPEMQSPLLIGYGFLWILLGIAILRGIKKSQALSFGILLLLVSLVANISREVLIYSHREYMLDEVRKILIYLPLLCSCIVLKMLDTYDNQFSADHRKKSNIKI